MIFHRYSKIIFAVILLGALIFFHNSALVGYFKKVSLFILSPIINLAERYQHSVDDQELADLRQESGRLKEEILVLEKFRLENEEFKKILNFRKEQRISLKSARVLLYSQEMGREFLLLDQGKESGLEGGEIAISAEGLFTGIVKEAGDNYAKVEIASNRGEAQAVTIMPLGINAVAKGLGARTFALELIPSSASLNVGDLAGVTVKGSGKEVLLLAEIVSEKIIPGAAFQDVKATLIVRPENLESVFIIK